MSEKLEFIRASEVGEAICRALDIDPRPVQRIVLDLDVRKLPVVYVQLIGDRRLLDVSWKDVAPSLKVSMDGNQMEAGGSH